jgi:hypothetical protein
MRSVKAVLFFGGLWLLGACVVSNDSPVAGSKRIAELDGREIIALCDWARDYMGGIYPNAPEAPEGGAIGHRCPPTPEDLRDGNAEETYVYWVHDNCPGYLAAQAEAGCQLTVDQFEGWVAQIADSPCDRVVYSDGECTLEWLGAEEI